MKAYVCDKCGKVILIEDDKAYYSKENGIYHLVCDSTKYCDLDLCEDCVHELMGAVREVKDGDNQ